MLSNQPRTRREVLLNGRRDRISDMMNAGLLESGAVLSISHYHAVLGNEECWNDLGWRLQRKRFVNRLDDIREIRNRVMHFSKDAVRDGDVDMIQNSLKTIRRYNGS